MTITEARPPQPRITLRDPALPHQIVIRRRPRSHQIQVTCNCLRKPNGSYDPIGNRELWVPGSALAEWIAWHARREAGL